MQRFAPVLRAFGTHLAEFATAPVAARPLSKVS
jgi:hypothetical protein